MPPLGTASTPGGSYIPLAGTPPAEVVPPAPTARLLEFELSCNICPVIMTASEANQDMSSDLNASQGRMQGRTGQAWPPTILIYVIFICYSDCQDPSKYSLAYFYSFVTKYFYL